MVFKITYIEAVDDLLELDITYFKQNPDILKQILLKGYYGYSQLPYSDIATYYALAFPDKVKGHLQLVDSVNPKLVLAEHIIEPDRKKPFFRILKGGKKNKT